MKRIAALALVTFFSPPSLLAATQVGPVDVEANIAVVSDYIWRGISQTDRNPALQGGLDISHNTGFYMGVWGSKVDFNDHNVTLGDRAKWELDIYGGWRKKFDNGLGVDVGILHYDYPGGDSVREYNFEDFYLGLSYEIMGVNLGAKYSYSPDFIGSTTDKNASYVDLKASYTMPPGITLTGHYGINFGEYYENTNGSDGYNDFSVALSGELIGLTLEAGLYGTDRDGKNYVPANSNWADDRLMVKVSKIF